MPENYAVDYYSNVDLHNNQLKNVVVDKVETDPAGTEGRYIYNTTEKVLKYHDGTSWVTLAQGGDLSGYQTRTEKGQADGYASLGSDGKVPLTELPVGNAANSLVQLGGVIGAGEVIQWDGSRFTTRSLANIYTVKGSVDTYDELPIEGNVAGDVYNVVAAHGTTPAGTNYVYTDEGQWDALGGSIDTSGFQITANLAQDLTSPGTSTYPSTQAVSNALAGKQDAISLTANSAVVSGADGTLEASTVTSTELGYLSGATSNIQTQLDGKQATVTGAATTIVSNDLTVSRVLVSNASGKVAASDVSTTVLGYLANVTSDIQGQIDTLTASLGAVATTYQAVAQKDQANGYAGLDGNGKIAISEVPTGVIQNTVPVITATGAGAAGQALVLNEGATGFEYTSLLERAQADIQGDGANSSFAIEHGLSGPPVGYVLVNNTTKAAVQTNVVYTSDTVITVNFNTVPTASESFTIYMVG